MKLQELETQVDEEILSKKKEEAKRAITISKVAVEKAKRDLEQAEKRLKELLEVDIDCIVLPAEGQYNTYTTNGITFYRN